MGTPNIKELKKLADACRKAGIKHFRSDDFEFTLTEDAPVRRIRAAKGPSPKANYGDDGKIETSELTPEQLLYYSVADTFNTEEGQS